jgi:hypothetical protein
MAIVIRVKRDDVDGTFIDPPLGTVRGVVRLWYEQPSPPAAPGIPLTRSNKSIVIGDDIGPISGPVAQRYGESIRSGDVQRLGGWEQLLTARGLSLDDYINNRSFQADLAVPASVIDAYLG